MKLMTISEVSKNKGISTRMLRYYEQEGLIKSRHKEGYSYRVYDEETIARIEQIMILRKLRIPVRQIQIILDNQTAVTAVDIFLRNIGELNEEITALSTIKDILNSFIIELVKATELPLHSIFTDNDTLIDVIESLNIISINPKEVQSTEKLKKADERLSRLQNVRIIYLPPATIASAHIIGEDPEMRVNQMIDDFVLTYHVNQRKPDLRHYGFNHPNPYDETGYHGYEAWVTIPDDMEVPKPLVKKKFAGGLYGAHTISFGNFGEWDALLTWANSNELYDFAGDIQDQEHMCGLMEEHLNYYNHIGLPDLNPNEIQLDLLIPLKKK